MRIFYWYISAYLRKYGLIIILSLLVALIFFSIIIPVVGDKVSFKPKKYIGIIGAYSIYNLPEEISTKLSAGLTKINDDGSATAHLAQQWIVNEDLTEYNFELKPEIYWQDQSMLTPLDINYTFTDVEIAVNENNIIYKLKGSLAAFPTILNKPIIKIEQDSRLFKPKMQIIGIGNTKVTDYKLRKSNQEELSEISLITPENILIYRFYSNESEAITAFKHGQIDQIINLSQKPDVESWRNVELIETIDPNTHLAVFFNNNKPIFTKTLRQALALASSRTTSEHQAFGPISTSSWAYLPGLRTFDQDTNRAIERALEDVPQQKIEFTIQTTPLFVKIAEKLKSEWEDFGEQALLACETSDRKDKNLCENLEIKVNIRVTGFIDTQNFDVILAAQSIPADPDQYALWHSEQNANFTQFNNARIDKLLEEGRQTLDQNKRKEIYQEFQQFFVDEVPVKFLHYMPKYTVKRK